MADRDVADVKATQERLAPSIGPIGRFADVREDESIDLLEDEVPDSPVDYSASRPGPLGVEMSSRGRGGGEEAGWPKVDSLAGADELSRHQSELEPAAGPDQAIAASAAAESALWSDFVAAGSVRDTGDAVELPATAAASKEDAAGEMVAEPAAARASESEVPETEPAEPGEPVLAGIGVMDQAFDTGALLGAVAESQHQPTGDELQAAAEAADMAGDSTTLRSLLLWTARAYAREGRFEAGLDATHRLLQRSPGDVDAHLVLVELYVARDWNNLAAEKLVLLGRLADLNNDAETKQRLCAVANRTFPGDQRLAALYG